ncbi:hypothetical protein CCR75_004600 [Bremia lactucae]|uniref:Uncharacterized protein n=1 Tax=Bremia lactucae TaxID=4779 RepID=A0A976FL21_BRELC|nr:hypothetical protein CCR75_004600 [Bremia lactucae]
MESGTRARIGHFALGPASHMMQKPLQFRIRFGLSNATINRIRQLLLVTFLLLCASDARRAVAEPSHPYRRVEVRVEDYSFTDRPGEKQQVAVEAYDIQGSDFVPWPDVDVHVVTWETTDKPFKKTVETKEHKMKQQTERLPAVVDLNEIIEDLESDDANNKDNDAVLKQYVSYRRAMWWWSEDKTELNSQEQAAVLAVVVAVVTVFGLCGVLLWNVSWFLWRLLREKRTLNQLFFEDDPIVIEQHLGKFSEKILSLRIKQIACVRLRHLQVYLDARNLMQQLESVTFLELAMKLEKLPLHPSTRKEMTFAEINTAVEEITCRGEQIAVEMMQLEVPSRWKRYADAELWLRVQDNSLQSLHIANARVQQIAEQISELIMEKINSSEPLSKPVFISLLASLRQTSGTPHQNGAMGKATINEMDAFNRCWSGSMSISGSVGHLGGGIKEKDEFSFLLKAFDEKSEQHKIQAELHRAIECFQSAHEPEHEQLLLLENADNSRSNQAIQRTNQLGVNSAANSGVTTGSMRRLERWVDQAEVMEMTFIEEVENAQFLLEDARRDSFCAAVVSNEGKGLDSVQTLATNFVALGAKREDAILKAGEILANRSNMMLLVNSLRTMFDQLRKRDVMKMNERRNRDRVKAQEKRDRIVQKFVNKKRIMAEKIDRTREAQRQREEEARLRRQMEEWKDARAQDAQDRASFVWKITKADVLVVLVIMAIVFFENVREVALVKPLCQPDEEHHWWMVSWWAPASFQVFGCEVAYGIKILGVLAVLGVVFFLLSQLNLVAVMLPMFGAIALYFVRNEWLNMLLRLPLLLVIYAFNLGILHLFNRYEDRCKDDQNFQREDKDSIVHAAKQRRILLYVVFPIVSLVLTVVTGVGVACDYPEQCVGFAYAAAMPVLEGLWKLARGAYRL